MVQKKFGFEIFLNRKVQNKLWVNKNCVSINLFGPKNFGPNKWRVEKKFGVVKNLGFVKKIFSSEKKNVGSEKKI